MELPLIPKPWSRRIITETERPFFFTIFFAIAIMAFTIPYNLLVPPQNYCMNGFPINTYMYLTAPFNIGCESSLTNLQTQEGQLRFFANYFVLLLYVFVVEFCFRSDKLKGRWKFFFAAILATYSLSVITFTLDRRISAGTSVIAISMNIILVAWLAKKAWDMKSSFRFILVAMAAVMASWLYASFLIGENPVGHAIGGAFFILYGSLYALEQDKKLRKMQMNKVVETIKNKMMQI